MFLGGRVEVCRVVLGVFVNGWIPPDLKKSNKIFFIF